MKIPLRAESADSEIGEDGNLTLPGLINYFQDCSTFQSEAIGEALRSFKNEAAPGAVRVADSCAPLIHPSVKR